MSKDNINWIQNDTYDNQDHLNNSEIMVKGEIEHSDIIMKLKDDNKYVLDSIGGNFEEKLLECSG